METKIEAFWRPATAEDIAKVMKGEKVEARFRDYEHRGWWSSVLNGWRDERESNWLDSDDAGWRFCQVYEPQQWWLDKPDPGEGWRLLGKFPDEPKLGTDEFFDTFDNAWLQVGDNGCAQYHGVWYRRRIEQPTPSNCVAYETQVDEVIQLPNGKRFKITKNGFEVF
jgi:hypothetical protein